MSEAKEEFTAMNNKRDIKLSIHEAFPGLWTYTNLIETSMNALTISKSDDKPLTTLLHYYHLRCRDDLRNLKIERTNKFYGQYNDDDELNRIENELNRMSVKLNEEVESLVKQGFVNEFDEEYEEDEDSEYLDWDWSIDDPEFNPSSKL